MGRLIIILCITYPLSIVTSPDIMRLTASLCIKGTATAVEHAVYNLDAQGNHTPVISDSSVTQQKIALQKCTLQHKDRFATIKYEIPTGGTKPSPVMIHIMFGMENIVKEYPADLSKYIRFSLMPIDETSLTTQDNKQ